MLVTVVNWIWTIIQLGLIVFVCFAPYKWQMRSFERKYSTKGVFIYKLKIACIAFIIVGIILPLIFLWVRDEIKSLASIEAFLPITLAYWIFCIRMCVILWEETRKTPEVQEKEVTKYKIY